MNKEDSLELELILFPMIISKFELIDDNLSPIEKTIAKNEAFESMEKNIEEFCKEKNSNKSEVQEKLLKIAETRVKIVKSKQEYRLFIEYITKLKNIEKDK